MKTKKSVFSMAALCLLCAGVATTVQSSELYGVAITPPMQSGTVSGTMTVSGTTVSLKHVYASIEAADPDEIDILFTDQPLPENLLGEQVKIAQMRYTRKVQGAAMTINFDTAAARVTDIFMVLPSSTPEVVWPSDEDRLVVEKLDSATIAGKFMSTNDGRVVEVSFSAPIRRQVQLGEAERGTLLKSPFGQALNAFIAAIKAADKAAIRQAVSSDSVAMLDKPEADMHISSMKESFDQGLELSEVLKTEEVYLAVLEQRYQDGSSYAITLALVQQDGAWKVLLARR